MTGVGSLSLNVLVPAIPGLAVKFQTDTASVQLTVSLYLMGLALAQLVFGPLSDRFGRRPVILAGLALATIASTAAIFAAGIATLIVARLVQSLGASTGQTIGRAIIRDLYDREHAASMIGLVTSVVVLLPVVAPLIGGILDTLFGWESIFVFSALVAGGVFLWAVLALARDPQGLDRAGRAQPFPRRGARAARARASSATRCARDWARRRSSPSSAPRRTWWSACWVTPRPNRVWFFLPSIGFMAGNFAVSRLSRRFTIDTLIWWGIVLTIIGCVLNIVVYRAFPGWDMATIFLPQIVIGLGNGLLLPTSIAGAVSIRPQVAGTASA